MACQRANSSPHAIHVSAAVSLSKLLQEISVSFERQHGIKLILNFAGSHALTQQIKNGAQVDVFLSADQESMDELVEQGWIEPSSVRPLLKNALAWITPKPHDLKLKDLETIKLAVDVRWVTGDPHAVPLGKHVKKYLMQENLWDEMAPRLISMDNARAALSAVETQHAKLGMVYHSDALSSQSVHVLLAVPAEETPWIVYPMGILKASTHPEASRKFLGFLQTDEVRQSIQKHGFLSLLP